jgi:pyridoxal phosphate-dependent aminotransferase EpsN
MKKRLYLSPPHVGEDERRLIIEAFDSNWIAPLGPQVDAFEQEMCDRLGGGHAVALSSGTAALHLALLILGVKPGDKVLVSTLTFSATANAVTYCGAVPVFVDCHPDSWCIDPALVAEELERAARAGESYAAVLTVDLYGQCADYDRIRDACTRHGVPLVQDAAEALGADYRGAPAGRQGDLGILSFNGNKIITTSGGGMLLSDRKEWMDQARFLATQARDPAPHYQHSHIGYNYRMSNLLAALGRGQLSHLAEKVETRRRNYRAYEVALGSHPGLDFMPEAPYGKSSRWLTCLTIDPAAFGATREQIRLALEAENIESRPIWKPMHLQPVFADCRYVGLGVSDAIFADGLCLPSGSAMTDRDLARVVGLILECGRREPAGPQNP